MLLSTGLEQCIEASDLPGEVAGWKTADRRAVVQVHLSGGWLDVADAYPWPERGEVVVDSGAVMASAPLCGSVMARLAVR